MGEGQSFADRLAPRREEAVWIARRWPHRAARRLLHRRAVSIGEAVARRSAVVFSPHYDDETLGCGGTIICKRLTGAEVTIVYMTDGSRSHAAWTTADELSRLRSLEGREAAGVLGVDESHVVELRYPETRLSEHTAEAAGAVAAILCERRPADVFVPYRHDPPADHRATTEILCAALPEIGLSPMVYEYPIWAWNRWPWVSSPIPRVRGWRAWLRERVKYNLRLMRDMRVRVDIGPVVSQKREALARHRTQTAKLTGDPTWPILADVANGEFLACFFQGAEFFAVSPAVPTVSPPSR